MHKKAVHIVRAGEFIISQNLRPTEELIIRMQTRVQLPIAHFSILHGQDERKKGIR